MGLDLSIETLAGLGISPAAAGKIRQSLLSLPTQLPEPEIWSRVSRSVLAPDIPFAVHSRLYEEIFKTWDHSGGPPPAWAPLPAEKEKTNVARLLERTGNNSVSDLHFWSTRNRADFWASMVELLAIRFNRRPTSVVDLSGGVESPAWFPGARMNIAESCFNAPPNAEAVVYQREGGRITSVTYGDLERLSNRVANSLDAIGLKPAEKVAIAMPMTLEAVAAYIGVVKAGCCVVSIADSFAPDEIATRLRITRTRTVVTQDVVIRAGAVLPMYEKVVEAGAERIVVIPAGDPVSLEPRRQDVRWRDFLTGGETFSVRARDPSDHINILFSSGTTGEPKAIPWEHVTPVKCAADGYLHQDIQPGDVVAWPTNLGWMMGPWLIFATLINRGTMALYYGAPGSREFCEFVAGAGVSILGVVPSLVKSWRSTGATDGLDWSRVKAFSSTGEASNVEDMLYLMSRAGYKPVIEYCGGTEIGGGYVTGTLAQSASPATFSTPAFGLDMCLLDEAGKPSDTGEVFLIPPSIGLSNDLLNKDHHEVYYEGTPAGPDGAVLRRHGDQMERLPGGYYRALGRADDTMNLGGIKTSAAEIERVVSAVEGVSETAAVAVSPEGGGPSRLIIFAVLESGARVDAGDLIESMQRAIARHLNPLFKIHDVVLADKLPRTASNKVMRRELRSRYAGGTTDGG